MNRSLSRSFFFLLCCLLTPILHAQNWRPLLSTPMNGSGKSSFFFNEMKGFVGFDGVNTKPVLRTTDGGATWTAVNFAPSLQTNPVHPVTDIWFRDSLTGWITMWSSTGGDPCLWHTTDGGSNWYAVTAGLSQMHYPASVRQTANELLVTEHPTINGSGTLIPGNLWSSTDSGGTWSRVQSRNIGLCFLNNTFGISTSYRSQFMYTNTGGASWSSSSAPNNFVHEAWSAYPWKQEGIIIAIPEDSGSTGAWVYRTKHFTNGFLWERTNTQLPFTTCGHVAGVNQVLYVQKYEYGTFGTGTAGFYRSLDTGNTWINVGGPSGDQDNRFSVTGCGDVVYAFGRGDGQIYKTTNGGGGPPIPQCVFINTDSLGTLTASVCDSAHNKYWLHNTNYGDVFIQDLRIIDTVRKPWKSGSVYYDSIPIVYAPLAVGDSLLIDLGWRPRLLMDSAGRDSAVLRVIFTVPYLGYKFDTIYLPLRLKTIASPAAFSLSSASISADSVDPCMPFDSSFSFVNLGCDTLTINSSIFSPLSPWTLRDSSGNTLSFPIRLAPNQSVKYTVSVHPNGTKSLKDSVAIYMRYQGKDSATYVRMEVSGKYIQAAQATLPAMQFDSIATCISYDSLVTMSNASCDTITITSADLTGGDWTILDINGNAVTYPIKLAPGTHGILKLRFAPKLTGQKSGKLTLHVLSGATTSTTTMQLGGIGVDNGTLAYLRAYDIGNVSICSTMDTTITFVNTSCGTISVRDARSQSNFVVIDSGSLPKDVAPSKSISLHVRFTPSGLGQQKGWIYVYYRLDGNDIKDSIAMSATTAPGASTFSAAPALRPLAFSSRTECDKDSTATWTISNTSICGATRVSEVMLDGNLAPTFVVSTDKTLPALITPGNDLTITLAIAQLVSGTYSGNMHIKFELAEGTMHDTLVPVTLAVTGGPHYLVLDTNPVDFGNISGCAGHDTVIWVSDSGCAGLSMSQRSITGAGFSLGERGDSAMFVKPGDRVPVHIHYDGSGSGAVLGQLTVTTNSGIDPIRTIDFKANVQAAQSVNFIVKVTGIPVKKGDHFDVSIYPDRDASINGLTSISGILEYHEDNFEAYTNPTVMSGTNLSTWSGYSVLKQKHYMFSVTSANSIVLKQNTPILTLTLEDVVADSSSSTIVVDSLKLGGSTPNFSDCLSTAPMTSTSTSFNAQCGDSLMIGYLRDGSILLFAPPNPNPLTRESGGKLHFGLKPSANGIAEIEVFDALGRSRSKLTQPLAAGMQNVELDLSSLEGGSYHYTIHFESSSGTAEHRGSIVVMR